MAVEDRQTNNEELLQLAIKAAKSGQKEGARVMFRQVYARDRTNETAMLWLAKLADSPKQRAQWLERVLDVNPENDTAKRGLQRMNYQQTASDNRILIIFGAVAGVMLIIVVIVLLLIL
jgi:thioredoxin-like negative regulator of GroEL